MGNGVVIPLNVASGLREEERNRRGELGWDLK